MSAEKQQLLQEVMIERVRELCHEEDRLVAAMMYGSFAQGEGDEFSDIEFILLFDDDALKSVDQEGWVSRIAPVELYFVNEFGVGTAIFDGLIRGEFHFDKASDIPKIDESWKDTDWFPSLEATLVLDRTGELSRRLQSIVGPTLDRDTPEQIQFLCNCFVNWFLFVSDPLARALDLLGIVRDQLLRMVRVSERSTEHWFNPSKFLEKDISKIAYNRYTTCTAVLSEASLRNVYDSAWSWGKELMPVLAEKHEVALPEAILERLDQRLTDVGQGLLLE